MKVHVHVLIQLPQTKPTGHTQNPPATEASLVLKDTPRRSIKRRPACALTPKIEQCLRTVE